MKPTVKLSGENGNVFSIISRVSKALDAAGLEMEKKSFKQEASKCQSYDEVLQLAFEYCDVN